MSIRWRLTLWFSLMLLLILSFSGVVLSTLSQHYLYKDVDHNLQLYSSRVHGTFDSEVAQGPLDHSAIHSRLPPVHEFSSPGIYIQVIDAGGNIVARSNNLVGQELPASPQLLGKGVRGETAIQTLEAGNDARVRIMISPLHIIDQTFVLEVAQSLKPADETLRRLRLALIIGIVLALLLTTAMGNILVRRALAPVGRITHTARGIEEGSHLDRRVGYAGPRDEIGELAVTFDHMIERLGKTFESQKHFIADASHELRTPLTVIQGNLDLLRRNMGVEDRKQSLRAIDLETKRMSRITSELLLLAEVEAGEMARQDNVSLKGIVLEELRRAQLQAGNRKIVLGRLDDLSVRGDAYKLNQALGNLVDNAVKYTPGGGAITLSLFKDKGWARLEVADAGIGIATEDLPHIFDRFYRVDNARSIERGGTGLGLAIVKGIVEQHGGRVTVASQPGKGSDFTVWLRL